MTSTVAQKTTQNTYCNSISRQGSKHKEKIITDYVSLSPLEAMNALDKVTNCGFGLMYLEILECEDDEVGVGWELDERELFAGREGESTIGVEEAGRGKN